MTYHPFSTANHRIPFVNAVAQCERCKQTTSYDATDAYEGRALTCQSGPTREERCGGRLKLYGQVPLGSSPD